MNREGAGKILCFALACYIVISPTTAKPNKSETPVAADEKQQVLDLEKEWVDAEMKRDATALERILDDKFIATFGVGKPRDKETFIKAIASRAVDPTESQTLTDQTVIIDQETAVVVDTDTLRRTDNGQPVTMVGRSTSVYIRRQGKWMALAEHMAIAPQAK